MTRLGHNVNYICSGVATVKIGQGGFSPKEDGTIDEGGLARRACVSRPYLASRPIRLLSSRLYPTFRFSQCGR